MRQSSSVPQATLLFAQKLCLFHPRGRIEPDVHVNAQCFRLFGYGLDVVTLATHTFERTFSTILEVDVTENYVYFSLVDSNCLKPGFNFSPINLR